MEASAPQDSSLLCAPPEATRSTPPPDCVRASLAPPSPRRETEKGPLKIDIAREPMLPSLFEPFAQVCPQVRDIRLLTIWAAVACALNLVLAGRKVTRDKLHRWCIVVTVFRLDSRRTTGPPQWATASPDTKASPTKAKALQAQFANRPPAVKAGKLMG